MLRRLEPEDFRIAKVGHVQIEDGILGILGPGAAAIVTIRQVLSLESAARCRFRSVSGIDGYQARLAICAEAAGVVLIDNGAASEDHDAVLFRQRDRQL